MTAYFEHTRAFGTDGERGRVRAGDADRDRVVELLKAAYSEGRLSKDEYDARVGSALSARTYADLDLLVSDLPVARPVPVSPAVSPATRINNLAIASIVCGFAQLMFGPLATIPAIIFGHMARGQIRRTGERGAGLALAGLVLGWGAVVLGIILVAVIVSAAARMGTTVPGHPFSHLPPNQFQP